jgi:hypothetical protein
MRVAILDSGPLKSLDEVHSFDWDPSVVAASMPLQGFHLNGSPIREVDGYYGASIDENTTLGDLL